MAKQARKGSSKSAGRGKGAKPARPKVVRQSTLSALVTLTSRLFARALHARLVPHGVAPGQLPVLQRLWSGDGLTQAELARAVRVEQPTMARTLDRMARDGLIERVPSKEDRRAFNVRLTARGRALRRAVEGEAAALDRAALASLKRSEREVLSRGVVQVAASLGEAAEGEEG
ncbi:MAG: MarR family winged helix-turn-helix transcriptional regulator [Alphaproteobacteria bacterium]